MQLHRQLGISYNAAWRRDDGTCGKTQPLSGAIDLDDAYLSGERSGGKRGQDSVRGGDTDHRRWSSDSREIDCRDSALHLSTATQLNSTRLWQIIIIPRSRTSSYHKISKTLSRLKYFAIFNGSNFQPQTIVQTEFVSILVYIHCSLNCADLADSIYTY